MDAMQAAFARCTTDAGEILVPVPVRVHRLVMVPRCVRRASSLATDSVMSCRVVSGCAVSSQVLGLAAELRFWRDMPTCQALPVP